MVFYEELAHMQLLHNEIGWMHSKLMEDAHLRTKSHQSV